MYTGIPLGYKKTQKKLVLGLVYPVQIQKCYAQYLYSIRVQIQHIFLKHPCLIASSWWKQRQYNQMRQYKQLVRM